MKKYIFCSVLLYYFIIIADAQNVYRLNNKFSNDIFKEFYKVDQTNGSHSSTAKKIASSLKGYIAKQSDAKDTLYVKFWDIKVESDSHKGAADVINSTGDNGATFAYYIDWSKISSFKVPFKATAVTATSIPFRYRLKKDADLEADFLNVGVNLLFVNGTTKFFKHEQISPRQSYWAWGPFVAFSQQKIDSSNTEGKVTAEKNIAAISYGLSGMRCWNGFSILLAIGFDNSIGTNAKYWEDNNFKHGLKPWIGFGFGIKLTDLAFKTTNDEN